MRDNMQDKWVGIIIGIVVMILATVITVLFTIQCRIPVTSQLATRIQSDSALTAKIEVPNPAMKFCEERNGGYVIYALESGGEQGLCVFSDSVCDADAFYKGECGENR